MKILLVDANLCFSEVIRKCVMASFPDAEVDSVPNHFAAEAFVEKYGPYDFVVIENILPYCHGVELAETLNKHAGVKNATIVWSFHPVDGVTQKPAKRIEIERAVLGLSERCNAG